MVLKNIAPPRGKLVTLEDGREIRVFPIGGRMGQIDALLAEWLEGAEGPQRAKAMKAQTGLYLAYATGQEVDQAALATDPMGVGVEYFTDFGGALDAADIRAVISVAVGGHDPLARGSQSLIGG